MYGCPEDLKELVCLSSAGGRSVMGAQENLENELFIFHSVCVQKHVSLFSHFGIF